jgi:hypothetical protein
MAPADWAYDGHFDLRNSLGLGIKSSFHSAEIRRGVAKIHHPIVGRSETFGAEFQRGCATDEKEPANQESRPSNGSRLRLAGLATGESPKCEETLLEV